MLDDKVGIKMKYPDINTINLIYKLLFYLPMSDTIRNNGYDGNQLGSHIE